MNPFKKKQSKPPYLYHATFPSRVASIQEEGINNNYGSMGVTFMCDSLEGVKQFTHGKFNRWAHEMSAEDVDVITDTEGREFKFPKVVLHDKVAVFVIPTEHLDWEHIHDGTDHNPNFYTAKVYMYADYIKPEWIKETIYIPFES